MGYVETPVISLSNQQARRLFLDKHALSEAPTGSGKGEDLLSLITRLGFVQLDSVRTVERAHHMILFARRQSYRPKTLISCWKRTGRYLNIGPRRINHPHPVLPALAPAL